MRCAAAPAAADALEAAAFAALERRLDVRSPAPVAIALSGGGDSIALLRLAARWGRRPLLCLIVDHRLNPQSGRWSAFAQAAAAEAGAAWRGLAWDGGKPARGLPAAARAARHRLLAEAARGAGARVVLTGHTLDDVIEGERMRAGDAPALGRLREWSPSPAWPEGRGLFLLRPLLSLRRAALRDWLEGQGATWIEDPANQDLRFARSRARLAGGPVASPPEEDDAGAAALARACTVTSDGRIELERGRFAAPGARRFLSAALLCAAGTARPPRGEALDRLAERLAGAAPVDATLAGARVVADAARVAIARDVGERFRGGLEPLALAAGETGVWDGRFEVEAAEPARVEPLGGLIARLDGADRARLRSVPAWARGALPAVVVVDGKVGPAGFGPAAFRSLAAARLAAACGLAPCEAEIAQSTHGADASLTLSSRPTA